MSDHLVDAAREPDVAVVEPDAVAVEVPDDDRQRSEGWWQRWRERQRTRVTRWDRTPPPKDWRYFVGMLGKVLIATGLLMFGFVAYQLWGTGIETARAQNRLEGTFEERFEAAVAATPSAPEPDPPAEPPTEPPADAEPTVGPGIGGTPSSIVPGAIDLSDDAVEQGVPIVPGEAFAKLDIDKIGIHDLYVIPGVQLDDLKQGPGHYPDTPLPGQLGNAAIAGHRTTFGAPFFDLDQLEPDDEIVVTMVTGDRFVYRVTGSEVVTAADYWVITTRDPNVAELTLTTCDPKYTARNRLVVHSVLVPDESAQVGLAEYYDLDEPDADSTETATTGDDPTVTTPTDAPDETPTTPNDDASAAPPVEPAEIDAFSHGWFEDRAAFAQIALWGAALIAIAVGGYQIAKRTRHDSIGVLVGVVPFVVALYFFYQNVNRLLPPGL